MQKKLEQFAPYILPLLAFIFVAVMFIRWYGGKTANRPEGSLISDSLQVTSLSQDEEESIVKGTADYSSVEMMAVGG